jgi:2-methylisocitrate lyase-like PEP mutase family enzyme
VPGRHPGTAPKPQRREDIVAEKSRTAAAEKLRDLHADGVLVLPNAWDAGSAAMIAQVGAQAIATASGGIAWSLGYPDGQRLTRAEMIQRVREIVAVVTHPGHGRH